MSKKEDISKLYRASFKESGEWLDWYFDNVYDDNKALLSHSSSLPVSCLMLDSYRLKLGESTVGMAYISGVTTERHSRRCGHARRLINDALMESAQKGDVLAALIPSSPHLYYYYSRLGFSTVFFTTPQRYTSLHRFTDSDRYETSDFGYDEFHSLEMLREATVLHSQRDYGFIIDDNRIDKGHVVGIRNRSTNEPAAMLFAVSIDEDGQSATIVKDLLSVSDEAAETALARLRGIVGESKIIVHAQPVQAPQSLSPCGMGRIINVETLLQSVCSGRRNIDQVIRVRDKLIRDNDAIFIIHDGEVEAVRSTMRRITLDVTAEVLSTILFNSHGIGDIFGLPSFRPSLRLMLD